ncbi:porin family protein [uncultured Tenacibaculum sp.]|uniref:porin family protein n=1 Tax=uncultured Tenacibaculum sp. TaxID=174713 RepID=UPI00263062F0|nr:porin family protein [uncultured Tenacibaculum sp.]
MKKVSWFTTLIIVLGLTNLNAQETKFGIKGGLNFAQITGANSLKSDRKTDFNVGVMAEIPISEKFSFQPELLYSKQGSSVNLDYLNIPLLGKYYLTEGLSIQAGPQIGFLLSANTNGVNVKRSFKTFDFGVDVGLGYQFKNGLSLGARYNYGLSNISTGAANQYASTKIKNEVFQVSIGYFLF